MFQSRFSRNHPVSNRTIDRIRILALLWPFAKESYDSRSIENVCFDRKRQIEYILCSIVLRRGEASDKKTMNYRDERMTSCRKPGCVIFNYGRQDVITPEIFQTRRKRKFPTSLKSTETIQWSSMETTIARNPMKFYWIS